MAGIDSPGLTSSPAVALRVIDLIRSSSATQLPLTPKHHFIAHRPAIIIPKTPEFLGRIDDPNPQKNIICRCERVTEVEIEDAITRPIPATTVTAVKRRTRAGMGPCQGTFCEPRVVALLAKRLGVEDRDVERRERGSSLLPHRRVTKEDGLLLEKLSIYSSKM